MVLSLYAELCNLVIRPTRCVYNVDAALGPNVFEGSGLGLKEESSSVSSSSDFDSSSSHSSSCGSSVGTEGSTSCPLNESTTPAVERSSSSTIPNPANMPAPITIPTIHHHQYVRQDLQIKNCRNMNIECSLWTSTQNLGRQDIPVVIYCAGNCGSRCDALDAVALLLPLGISIFAFDFCGSGLSDGEYVSLGFYEQLDLKAVTSYLRTERKVGKIALWGRSMGAATCIMYAAQRTGIAGIVADSPFSSLEQVMIDLVRSNAKIPKTMIRVGINIIRKTIRKKAKFDIIHNAPIEHAPKADAPIIFAGAYGDDFIHLSHSEKLYHCYGGDKEIIRFEGDHNSERPQFFYDSVAVFFYNVLVAGTRWDATCGEGPQPGGMRTRAGQTPTTSEVVQRILRQRRSSMRSRSRSTHETCENGNDFGNSGRRRTSSAGDMKSYNNNSTKLSHKHCRPSMTDSSSPRTAPRSPLATKLPRSPSKHDGFPTPADETTPSPYAHLPEEDTSNASRSFILSMLSSIQDELDDCDDEDDRRELLQKLEEYKRKAADVR